LNFDDAKRVVERVQIDVVGANIIAPMREPDIAFAFASWIKAEHPLHRFCLAQAWKKLPAMLAKFARRACGQEAASPQTGVRQDQVVFGFS
jgi:hypothetical protein